MHSLSGSRFLCRKKKALSSSAMRALGIRKRGLVASAAHILLEELASELHHFALLFR